jgi:hypothetical protein
MSSLSAIGANPPPGASSAALAAVVTSIRSDHLLAIGSIGPRTLILLDIEPLMGSAAMGLTSQTTH